MIVAKFESTYMIVQIMKVELIFGVFVASLRHSSSKESKAKFTCGGINYLF
jgi:hypothetical protein